MHVPKRQKKLFLEGIGKKKKLLLLATRKHTHVATCKDFFPMHVLSSNGTFYMTASIGLFPTYMD